MRRPHWHHTIQRLDAEKSAVKTQNGSFFRWRGLAAVLNRLRPVSFSATRTGESVETPNAIIPTRDHVAVIAGWLEISGQRVTIPSHGTAAGDCRCSIAGLSDDVAASFLNALVDGVTPRVGVQLDGGTEISAFELPPMPRPHRTELRMGKTLQAPIRLDSTAQLPGEIFRELQRLRSVFLKCQYVEQLLENSDLAQMALELDQVCYRSNVIGYHYTRAIREDIASRGLEVPVGTRRRAEFLTTHGHLFSASQQQWMQQMWDEYFNASQTPVREGRIFFCLTLQALSDGGAHRLLTNFGGELIYMPIAHDKEIAAILESIGEPLVVECELPTERVEFFSRYGLGAIWLSSYHVSVNPNARQHDVDARTYEPVLPSSVVRIHAPQRCGTRSWRI